MRFKQNFTLYPRKIKNGVIWYYRTYDNNGNRTPGTSTGLSSKIKAQKFCEDLYKNGLLYSSPVTEKPIGFYIQDFFEPSSAYLKSKLAEGTEEHPVISKSSLVTYKSTFSKHIFPYFKNMKIKDFTVQNVKKFRDSKLESGTSRLTINFCLAVLSIIGSFLVQEEIITDNPVMKVKRLSSSNNETKVDAFTIEEAKMIINSKKWNIKEDALITTVCCFTGMRISEVLALNTNELHPNYIDVKSQIDSTDISKIKNVKTKQARIIPIIPELYNLLIKNIKEDGFVFNERNRNHFYFRTVALLKLENMDEERTKRNLHVHSWRHFYNTYLLSKNISETKTNAIIGHADKNKTIQNIYTNFEIEHFQDVQQVNKELWNYIFN